MNNLESYIAKKLLDMGLATTSSVLLIMERVKKVNPKIKWTDNVDGYSKVLLSGLLLIAKSEASKMT